MKKLLIIVLLILFLLITYYVNNVENANTPCHIVLKYDDFGSSVKSSKLLGRSLWQWDSYTEDRDAKFDIKVVVYTQNEDLEKIKNQYPIIEKKNQDYRYVTYTEVQQYLKRIKTEDKEYFKGCRADACPELAFFDSLPNQIKPLNVSHCMKN